MADRDDRRRARIEADRRRRRGSGPAARDDAAVRRRNVALSAAAVLALGVAGWALFLRDGDGGDGSDTGKDGLASIGRSGSTPVAGAPDVTISSTPPAYQVVYRVEDVGKELRYRTDVVSVRRPWESRLESRAGRPPGKEGELSTEVATFGQRRTLSYGQSPVVVELGPVLPASDVRLDKVLAPAAAAGRIEKREVRKVLGRPCQVYRSGDYLSATAITPPTAALYTDSCVDADGLVLEELLVSEGKPIARRIAESVDLSPDLTDDLFPTGKATVDPSKGGGSMRRVVDGTTPPGPFYVADAVPEGFTSIGRYSVVPPQAENFSTDDPTREDYRRAQIADVYVRGLDVLVLEQGATLRGAPPFEVDPGNPTLDLGPFGQAEVRFSALGNQVRAQREGGRFVQATGTLLPDELAAVLRSLREVPGGELQLADG
jgi:hypothetical protein